LRGMPGPTDLRGRPMRSLRISVTDRCNLRCSYCMPENDYTWLPKSELLTFEEIATLTGAFCEVGTDKVRLTGGEPLMRRDLSKLVEMLADQAGLQDLALTTNAIGLDDQAADLRAAGLQRLTVSLDSLDPGRYHALTRRNELQRVLHGIEAASAAGFERIKLNTVVLRDVNDDELIPLLEFARRAGHELRFIEYMDVGGATQWSRDTVIDRSEILERLSAHFGPIVPETGEARGSAPAGLYRLEDGTRFGVIASTTVPFCGSCDRSRLTADGHWFLCLYATKGMNLAALLRGGVSREELVERLRARWSGREDRGAEERLAKHERGAFKERAELEDDPHLEMHTRGG